MAAASDTKRLTSLSAHPRASRTIKRVRAWGGLAGFALMAFVGYSSGAPLDSTLGRALVGGIIANLITRAVAAAVFKRILIAEATAAARRARAAAATAE